jgi:hypothetical protein
MARARAYCEANRFIEVGEKVIGYAAVIAGLPDKKEELFSALDEDDDDWI